MNVIYDGNCPVCNRLKDFAATRTPTERVRFIPYQADDFEQEIPSVTRQQAQQALHTVSARGETKSGAAAVFELMKNLSGVWKWLGYLLAFPPLVWLAEPFYRLFARQRHTA